MSEINNRGEQAFPSEPFIAAGVYPKLDVPSRNDPHSRLNVDIVVIRDWAHFVELADRFDVMPSRPQHGFRGHGDSEYSLTPSLVRRAKSLKLPENLALDIEQSSIREFKGQAHQFLPTSQYLDVRDGKLGWLTIMQHHGTPTRLLDWTESIYVALYFAVTSQKDLEGAVWAFNGISFLEAFPNQPKEEAEVKHLFGPGGPSTLFKFWWDCKSPRMIAQQGFFTASPNILASHDDILSSSLPRIPGKTHFAKLVIPAKLKPLFLAKLLSMNVGAHALLPGIDGVGRYIDESIWCLSVDRFW